jgi:O-methyltransferase
MNNTFITRDFDWALSGSRSVQLANRMLRALGKKAWVRAPYATGHMTTVEQRMNLYHMVSQVLAYQVPGDLVEVGCFTGQTAVLFAKVLAGEGDGSRKLHVYDSFEGLWDTPNPLQSLKDNFAAHGLSLPELHAGWFKETIPSQLPEAISFAHIDCGWGGDPAEHGKVIHEVMSHIYPRLARGAICSIVDYSDPREVPEVEDANPGVKPAFDAFLANKPEKVSVLYGCEYGHGYFRKQ